MQLGQKRDNIGTVKIRLCHSDYAYEIMMWGDLM